MTDRTADDHGYQHWVGTVYAVRTRDADGNEQYYLDGKEVSKENYHRSLSPQRIHRCQWCGYFTERPYDLNGTKLCEVCAPCDLKSPDERGECPTCKGDQYLQPCAACGKE